MNRRDLLRLLGTTALGSSVLGLACSEASVGEGQAGSWPGPTTPISYVTSPPPPVGSRLELSDDEWRRRLTQEQFRVLRQEGTERAGTCALLAEHREGTFHCAGCGAPLFESDDKFESGTGWPSFSTPLEGRVHESTDVSLGMIRTAVSCARCDGHLGHVFPDGPPPSGMRYCMNGVALEFVPRGA
jgi:peptide-methionine (R)-S-oxide reductase